MFCPWVGALWNLTFVFLPRIKGRWGWCLMEAILPRLPSFSNLLIWTHNLFVICTEEKRSKLKLFPHSSSASQLLSLSGLNAFNRNWKPGRTTKYGCCWFRSKPCPDLTFQSFFFFSRVSRICTITLQLFQKARVYLLETLFWNISYYSENKASPASKKPFFFCPWVSKICHHPIPRPIPEEGILWNSLRSQLLGPAWSSQMFPCQACASQVCTPLHQSTLVSVISHRGWQFS